MSDLLKSLTSASAAATLAGAGPGSAVPSALASAANLPAALANLAAGNVIAGVVIERGRAGIVLLKTDKGVLQLQTNLPLKPGAAVVLEVQSVGAQLRFAILSIDNRPPSAAPPIPLPLPEEKNAPTVLPDNHGEGRPARAAVAAPVPRPTLVGKVVTAEVVEAAPPAPQPKRVDLIPVLLNRIAAIAALSQPEGTAPIAKEALVARPMPEDGAPAPAARPPIDEHQPESAPPLPKASASAAPTGPQTQPSSHEVPTAPDVHRPTGEAAPRAPVNPVTDPTVTGPTVSRTPQPVTIRILAVLPPVPAGAPVATARPAVAIAGDSITLMGKVVAESAPGALRIATPIGTLRLPVGHVLPADAEIAFEVLAQPSSDARAAAAGAPPLDAPDAPAMPPRTLFAEPARTWPELDALLATAPMAEAGVTAAVPRPGPDLGPAILLFMAGLRGGGTTRSWLGQAAVDGLDAAGHGSLVARLDNALGAESATATANGPDGWQTVSIPIVEGQRISELRFHFERRRKRSNGGADDGGNRFVIEATLSALGPLQLDGRMGVARFDLLVRTARALPEGMRRDISALFASALAGTAYSGGVGFRADMMAIAAQRTAPRGSSLVI